MLGAVTAKAVASVQAPRDLSRASISATLERHSNRVDLLSVSNQEHVVPAMPCQVGTRELSFALSTLRQALVLLHRVKTTFMESMEPLVRDTRLRERATATVTELAPAFPLQCVTPSPLALQWQHVAPPPVRIHRRVHVR